MLQVRGLAYAFPNQTTLFHSIEFTLRHERVGLVGPNGIGKTTLLHILNRELSPTEGTVIFDSRPIQLLKQNTSLSPSEEEGLGFIQVMMKVEQGTAELKEWEFLDKRWAQFASIKGQLDRWDIAHVLRLNELGEASPGMQQRLRLALAFADSSALLLLDEPSNHLDREGRAMLHRSLREHAGPCLVSSHDRSLLGEMDRIMELKADGVRMYGGPYAHFREQKEIEAAAAQKNFEHAAKELRLKKKEAQVVIERQQRASRRAEKNKDKLGLPKILLGARKRNSENTLARLKSQHEERIESSQELLATASQAYNKTRRLHVDIMSRESRQRGSLVSVRNLNHRFDSQQAWIWPDALTFDIPVGERWAIAGRNGSGKSTLLKLLEGKLLPESGHVENRSKRAECLDQNLTMLPSGLSLVQLWSDDRYIPNESLKRTIAARLGIAGDDARRNLEDMSGGQRMRAALVLLSTLAVKPDLLILDEPTNHLDIETIESLTQTIAQLGCSLIVVSHDAQFLDELALDHILDFDKKSKSRS